jgi:hypothetical protein
MTARPWLGALLLAAPVAIVAFAGATGCWTPLPECSAHCNGNTRVSCSASAGDFPEPATEDCGQLRCVEGDTSLEHYALCASGGPDPRCNPNADDVFCEGETIATCRGAYVAAREDCAARGLLCAVKPFLGSPIHTGRCVESRTPDERCASDVPHLFCDGETRSGCFGPLLVHGSACAPLGKHCVVHGDSAACE